MMNYKKLLLLLLITIISVSVVYAADDVEEIGVSDVIVDQDLVIPDDDGIVDLDDQPSQDDIEDTSLDGNNDSIVMARSIPSNITLSNSTGNGTSNDTNDTNHTPVHPVHPVHPYKPTPSKHISFKNYFKTNSVIPSGGDDPGVNQTNETTRQNGISPSDSRFEKNYHNVLKEIDATLPVIIFLIIVLLVLVIVRSKK